MLGGLDDVGAHPIGVEPVHLGVPGQHRLQRAGPHLDHLLGHVVESSVLERREQVVQIAWGGLSAGLLLHRQHASKRATIALQLCVAAVY